MEHIYSVQIDASFVQEKLGSSCPEERVAAFCPPLPGQLLLQGSSFPAVRSAHEGGIHSVQKQVMGLTVAYAAILVLALLTSMSFFLGGEGVLKGEPRLPVQDSQPILIPFSPSLG